MSERGQKRKRSETRQSTEHLKSIEHTEASAPKRTHKADGTDRTSTSKDKPEDSESEAVVNSADLGDSSNSVVAPEDDGKTIQQFSPSKLRFTQDTISHKFRNGPTLDDTLHDLTNGKITVESIPKITVISNEGEYAYFTHDNRRLCVFQKFEAYLDEELLIPCVIGEPKDFPEKRITTRNLGKSVKIVKENYKSRDKNNKNHEKILEVWSPKKFPKAPEKKPKEDI